MATLFPLTEIFPPGFNYYSEFLSIDEEQSLIKLVSAIEVHNMMFQGFEAKRKTASFGFDYSFDQRKLKKGKSIPPEFDWLLRKVSDYLEMEPTDFAELLLTEYPVGSVINWHRDAPPFDLIAGISLNADCIFKLRPQQKEKPGRSSIISFPVERRSLYVISGQARSEWQHSIAPVKEKRYSITLRTLRK